MRCTSALSLYLTASVLLSAPAGVYAQPAPQTPEPPAAAPPTAAAPAPVEEPSPADAAVPAEPPAAGQELPPPEPPTEDGASEPMAEPDAVEAEQVAPMNEAEIEPEPMLMPEESAELEPPSPGDLAQRLNEGLEDTYDGKDTWTAPVPVFAMHGYMRMRGELMDTFWLGRPMLTDDFLTMNGTGNNGTVNTGVLRDALGPDPFSRFRSFERMGNGADCAGESMVDKDPNGNAGTDTSSCDIDTLRFANMRLRLSPEMNLTEDVRVHATFDVLDNVVAGQAPRSFYGIANSTTYSDTLAPAGGGGSSSIVARRAWAEVRNRDLGELRFGRMPSQWGLGMRYNAGNGLDHDYSTDMDRAMAIVKFAGFYFTGSYDFLAEGLIAPPPGSSANYGTSIPDYRPDLDRSQLDDVDQLTFSVARRLSEEEEHEIIQRGDPLLNGGVHFEYRHQAAIFDSSANGLELQRVFFTRYTPDLWGQFKWPWGRIEAETALAWGSTRDPQDSTKARSILQLGAVLESEFRFFEDKFAVYFYTGYASGDSSVEGLSANADYVTQLDGDKRISTYSFHPSYQVDMILWRNIMRQVTGAYYFKPGLSYDFVRSDFGELFGARADVIWSRASNFLQTPGNASNLGVELNAQVYWRSEDGAELTDGYHASLQYGVLFPLRGLGLPNIGTLNKGWSLSTAQQLRLILGVMF